MGSQTATAKSLAMNPLTPEGFAEAQNAALSADSRVFPARSWWPSMLGHPCDRFLVWRWVRWEEAALPGPVLQSIFRHGREAQPHIYERLEDMGFDVVREYDRPAQYEPRPGVVISGRPDGKLRGFKGERFPVAVPFEAKTMYGHAWQRIATADDLQAARSQWIRQYYAQGQLYLLLENVDQGAFVLSNKDTGLLRLLPFMLDYAYAESLLARIERLQPVIARREDPPPIAWEHGVCASCAFAARCYPAKAFGEGASVILDDDFIALLEARDAVRESSQRFRELDDAIKARLRREGIKDAIAGPFRITVTPRAIKGYTVDARTDMVVTIKRENERIPTHGPEIC